MQSTATTVAGYLTELPPDRRDALKTIRMLILEYLQPGFEEVMQYGCISYVIPLQTYPHTYNNQPLTLVSLASQKNHMAMYLMSVYGNTETEAWFREAYEASGKKLDMGKSCVRFHSLEDLALDVIGQTIARTSVDDFIAFYEQARGKKIE